MVLETMRRRSPLRIDAYDGEGRPVSLG
jgi:hypothetical protein